MSNVKRISLDITDHDTYLELPLSPDSDPCRAIISLNSAGTMSLGERHRLSHRRNIFDSVHINERRIFCLHQVHSQKVIVLARGRPEDYYETQADGFVTGQDDAVLSVTTADCLAIFLSAKGCTVRGLVHSGWQGTGIVAVAITQMADVFGVEIASISALIGPGIGKCCYAVHQERYHDYIGRFGRQCGEIRGNQCFLDLREANRGILERLGVQNITIVENCTHCSPFLGSYRRDGKEKFHNMISLFGRF